MLEGWSSVVLNTALAVFKGILGLMTGSVSLLADAVHTFSDSLTSVVVIFGFRMSERPADERHPFGHGRMEGLAAVVIGVLLAVAAVEMTQYAVERLIEKNPKPVHAETWVIASLVGTVVAEGTPGPVLDGPGQAHQVAGARRRRAAPPQRRPRDRPGHRGAHRGALADHLD